LLHERSGVEVSVSPDTTAGEGYVSRLIERGDLQREHPIVRLSRNVMPEAERSVEAEGLLGHCSSLLFDHLLYPGSEQALRRQLHSLSFSAGSIGAGWILLLVLGTQLPAPSRSSGFNAVSFGAIGGCSGDAGKSTTEMA
jgi:hypothetical protein